MRLASWAPRMNAVNGGEVIRCAMLGRNYVKFSAGSSRGPELERVAGRVGLASRPLCREIGYTCHHALAAHTPPCSHLKADTPPERPNKALTPTQLPQVHPSSLRRAYMAPNVNLLEHGTLTLSQNGQAKQNKIWF